MIRTTLFCLPLALAIAASSAQAATTSQQDDTSAAVMKFSSCTKPQYPHADIQAGHQGTVTLAFLVDETGRVKDSKVVKSSGFASLDEAAHTALAKCSFQAARKDGKPVQEWTNVQYVWSLH
jgi:protein TonB